MRLESRVCIFVHGDGEAPREAELVVKAIQAGKTLSSVGLSLAKGALDVREQRTH